MVKISALKMLKSYSLSIRFFEIKIHTDVHIKRYLLRSIDRFRIIYVKGNTVVVTTLILPGSIWANVEQIRCHLAHYDVFIVVNTVDNLSVKEGLPDEVDGRF